MPADARFIVNLDFSRLVERLLPPFKLMERELTGAGVQYTFTGAKPEVKFWAVVAVHANESSASVDAQEQIARVNVAPVRKEVSAHHDLVLWQTEDPMSGSLLLRRVNAVIRINDGIPWNVRVRLVEQIDDALQHAPEVTHAGEVHAPEIVTVKMPPQIKAGEEVHAELEVAGISPVDALFGTGTPNALITAGPKPFLTYYAPREPRQDRIVLLISTPGNLLSSKTLTVTVN